jgi:hypothetical protein
VHLNTRIKFPVMARGSIIGAFRNHTELDAVLGYHRALYYP